jgi:N-acetylglucosamine repressor
MAMILTGKPQLNRVINRSLILEVIRRDGAISRADLAKETEIRPPTVSAVVKELIEEGLVEEIGTGATRGGRAPIMISLARLHPRALGLEVSTSKVVAALCDLGGNICVERTMPFAPQAPEQAVLKLHEFGNEVLQESGIDWSKLHGVGVAVPGHLNAAGGSVRWSLPFGWRDVPLKELCEKSWGTTTDIVNDSVAGGMAAQFFDTARQVENLVYLNLRFDDVSAKVVGIGTGIILRGEPYHGEFVAAGEITTPVAHPLTYARRSDGQGWKNVAAFVKAVKANEEQAVAAMKRVGDELNPLVLHIVNLLEPGVLMVGSDAPVLGEMLLEHFRKAVDQQRLAFEAGKTRLIPAVMGEFEVARGAVVPTLRRVFRLPQWS